MKPTGIVRRIDNLGRIVIPMEIRRTFQIREGDPIEIFCGSDVIMLQKYDMSRSVLDRVKKLSDSINDEMGKIDLEKKNEIEKLLDQIYDLVKEDYD